MLAGFSWLGFMAYQPFMPYYFVNNILNKQGLICVYKLKWFQVQPSSINKSNISYLFADC